MKKCNLPIFGLLPMRVLLVRFCYVLSNLGVCCGSRFHLCMYQFPCYDQATRRFVPSLLVPMSQHLLNSTQERLSFKPFRLQTSMATYQINLSLKYKHRISKKPGKKLRDKLVVFERLVCIRLLCGWKQFIYLLFSCA